MLRKLFGRRPKNEERARFNETDLPALHIIKQNNIHKYRKAYGFKVFIETGTYLGDMVEAQRNHFEKIYSIELGEDLHQRAVKRFAAFPHVKILQGDSGVVLKDLLMEINEPALCWLDGHYSAGITAKGEKNTPILAELEVLLTAAPDHGILIDDARLFTGEGDYPSIDELSSFVMHKDSKRRVTVADDIIKIFIPR
ncbi:hypothetical protein [Parapedobacter sp. DT-150]|uniref:hypothetical protein n=1 Tax=Parapedobacter sp. DT-150 TaxID=3396162 RepID=UPI003F1B0206